MCICIHVYVYYIYIYISESTLCRDGPEKNGRPYISIANGKLKSLVIYTNK